MSERRMLSAKGRVDHVRGLLEARRHSEALHYRLQGLLQLEEQVRAGEDAVREAERRGAVRSVRRGASDGPVQVLDELQFGRDADLERMHLRRLIEESVPRASAALGRIASVIEGGSESPDRSPTEARRRTSDPAALEKASTQWKW